MHHTAEFDLVCIGSGPAGQRAAIQAAKLGKRVAVIEKQRSVGGYCVDTGTIPSKTFREAVRRVYSRPGLEVGDAPYRERVRPTMHAARRTCGTRDSARNRGRARRARAERHPRRARTGVLRGSAHAADRIRPTAGDGSRQRTSWSPSARRRAGRDGVDSDGRTITTSDTVLNLEQLPRTMVVVGAGVIGIEYASMFAALGVQVTVIDGGRGRSSSWTTRSSTS